jgi:two-component system, OmpR family, alkaline phosphatase synthesis response regulator PhoP
MSEELKKILMIEDDSFLRSLYRDKLKKEGFDFIEATSGVEGMNKIINEGPDLIILDILLPMKGGFDILEEMNVNGLIKEIPVIILSSLKQKSDIEEGRRLGAQDYFVKSETNFSEFLERIKEVI